MGFGGNIVWFGSGVGSPQLDPVVVDWVNRTVATGGTIAQSTQNVWDAYVKGCKADGYWDVLASGVIIPLASDSFTGCFTPLIVPSGGVLTNQNFVAADYSLIQGLDPGASNTNKELISNIQAQTIFTSTNIQISGYKRSSRTPSITSALAGVGTIAASRIAYLEAPSASVGVVFDSFNSTISQGRVQGSGKAPIRYSSAKLLGGRRSISFNGVEQAFNTTTGGTYPSTTTLKLFCFNTNFCINVFSFIYVGRALSDAQDLQHSDRVHAAQTALGRGV